VCVNKGRKIAVTIERKGDNSKQKRIAKERERQLKKEKDRRDRRFNCLTARRRSMGGERVLLLVVGDGCRKIP